MKIVFLFCVIASVCAQSYPPSGVYLSFAEAQLASIGQSITADVNNYIASYVVPPVNGSSKSGSYQFTQFTVSVQVDALTYSSTTAGDMNFGWNAVEFYFSWHYHVCANDILHPCEDGTIYVLTPNWNQKTITAEATLSFSGTSGAFALTGVALNAENGDIMTWIFCSDDICLIPIDDILDTVDNEFTPTFVKVFSDAVNWAAAKYIDALGMNLIFDLANYGDIEFVAGTSWFLNPLSSTITPGWIFASQGAVYVDLNGGITPPPFSPTFAPPDADLQNPSNPLEIYMTEYFFSTLVWALSDIGYFTREINDTEVPAASPVKLETNDPFFQSAVKGLSSYPNMFLNLQTKFLSFSQTTVDTNGIHLAGNSLSFQFTLYNASTTLPGWTLGVNLDVDIMLNVTGTANTISLSPSLANFNPNVTILQSAFANISTDSFVALFQLLEGVVKLPTVTLNLPKSMTSSGVQATFQAGYLGLGIDYIFTPTITTPENVNSNPNKYPPFRDTFIGSGPLSLQN